MRNLSLVLIIAALAACTTAPQPETRSARAEARLQELLAGKVAGQPLSCLPNYRSDDMIVIDDNTVLFRHSSNLVYRSDLQGACSNLGSGHYALLTQRGGGTGLCRGEIAQVVDVQNNITVGTCSFGDFVPYSRTGG